MQERIGRYELLERIASGGQGTVYRARDTVLDRVVAVKVINQNIEGDPAYLEALQREARLAARLSHPNIATVYDFQVENGTPYIVMEFVPDALDRELRGNERLPWRRAVEVGLQTSRALQHAHDQGVVHRDIKPQNILLRETGAAALSDFGIARAFASSTRSQSGGVMGTPAYMSPEQWDGGAVDSRLDQYGLGIVLYELITGSPPFQGDSWGALYVQHRDAPVPPISSSLQVPAEVESVIRKTLEKSPGARYGSASELANALQGTLAGGVAQVPRTEVSPQPPEPPRPPVASGAGSGRSGGIPSWPLFVGLGAAVIAVIAIVVSVVFSGGSESGSAKVIVPTDTPTPIYTQVPSYRPALRTTTPSTSIPAPTVDDSSVEADISCNGPHIWYVEPETAVIYQSILLRINGLSPETSVSDVSISGQPIDLTKQPTGPRALMLTPEGRRIRRESVDHDSSSDGNKTDKDGVVDLTFNIPHTYDYGYQEIEVADAKGCVASTQILIKEPKIELDSQVIKSGETLTIRGTNFPVNSRVSIIYSGYNKDNQGVVGNAAFDSYAPTPFYRQASATGSWTASWVPYGREGSHWVTASSEFGGRAHHTFQVTR